MRRVGARVWARFNPGRAVEASAATSGAVTAELRPTPRHSRQEEQVTGHSGDGGSAAASGWSSFPRVSLATCVAPRRRTGRQSS
jgi:hypothetical protein